MQEVERERDIFENLKIMIEMFKKIKKSFHT